MRGLGPLISAWALFGAGCISIDERAPAGATDPPCTVGERRCVYGSADDEVHLEECREAGSWSGVEPCPSDAICWRGECVGPAGELSCAQILDCQGGCGGDVLSSVCQQSCRLQGTEDAQAQLGHFEACSLDAGCFSAIGLQSFDCLRRECADESSVCFYGGPGDQYEGCPEVLECYFACLRDRRVDAGATDVPEQCLACIFGGDAQGQMDFALLSSCLALCEEGVGGCLDSLLAVPGCAAVVGDCDVAALYAKYAAPPR